MKQIIVKKLTLYCNKWYVTEHYNRKGQAMKGWQVMLAGQSVQN